MATSQVQDIFDKNIVKFFSFFSKNWISVQKFPNTGIRVTIFR